MIWWEGEGAGMRDRLHGPVRSTSTMPYDARAGRATAIVAQLSAGAERRFASGYVFRLQANVPGMCYNGLMLTEGAADRPAVFLDNGERYKSQICFSVRTDLLKIRRPIPWATTRNIYNSALF